MIMDYRHVFMGFIHKSMVTIHKYFLTLYRHIVLKELNATTRFKQLKLKTTIWKNTTKNSHSLFLQKGS